SVHCLCHINSAGSPPPIHACIASPPARGRRAIGRRRSTCPDALPLLPPLPNPAPPSPLGRRCATLPLCLPCTTPAPFSPLPSPLLLRESRKPPSPPFPPESSSPS